MLRNYHTPSTTVAYYTKLYKDVDVDTIDEIDDILSDFDDLFPTGFEPEITVPQAFMSKYRYYEICNEDEDVFIQCVEDTINLIIQKYKEFINKYIVDIVLSDATKVITSTSNNGAGTINDSNDNTITSHHYDFPNNTFSTPEKYETVRDKDVTDGSNTRQYQNVNTGSNTRTANPLFYDLKRQSLNLIRNITNDIVDEFYDCFLHIY